MDWSLDMESHSWGQNLHEVNATIPVPPGTKSRFIVCEMKKDHLKVGLKGEKLIIDGELFEAVKVDKCFWSLEDNTAVCVLMTKGKHKWWNSLLKGGPEVDIQKAEPEPCEFSDWDSESKSAVEKMVFEQRQKRLGLPTSNQIKSQQVFEQFMAENPNMNFFGAKFMSTHCQVVNKMYRTMNVTD
ncbi:protein BOBBER 2-like [Senna tora]|uniref:Protein BOBBER 2-like n=1 Tax=Senna tora TaxID=362788 RepID=A0A834TUC8_9FABA|nr:protein BOBBER 2-like [Senna tora]